jgi:hypothetical protein
MPTQLAKFGRDGSMGLLGDIVIVLFIVDLSAIIEIALRTNSNAD